MKLIAKEQKTGALDPKTMLCLELEKMIESEARFIENAIRRRIDSLRKNTEDDEDLDSHPICTVSDFESIQILARAEYYKIIATSLRPKLRGLVHNMLDDHEICQDTLCLLESDSTLRQSDLGQFLYPMAKTLVQCSEPKMG